MIFRNLQTSIYSLALLTLGFLASNSARAQDLPDGPGKGTLNSVCTVCHGVDIIVSQKRNKTAWKATVGEMKSKGAAATDSEFDVIVEYLAKNFGVAETAAAPLAKAGMPDGAGKQVILKICTSCHEPDHFTQFHHSTEEWQAIVARMGARANASKEDMDTILSYMSKNFPKAEDTNKVNINKATAQELSTRLALTPKEAEAIVNYRGQFGDFREWGDMLVILGVDGRKLEAVKERMSF